MEEPQAALEKAWASTCKVLFGEEAGSLPQYEKWLAELVDPTVVRKSSISGKEVIYSTANYSESAKSINLDEVDFNRKYPPLSINQIKDIDSIASAIGDRAYYSGNVVLGNSKYVEKSANISDCFYIYNTTLSSNDKYMAYCTQCRLDSYGFGGNAFSESEFCLKCHELTRVKRCFETWMTQDSANCYYSHGLKNCADCMFSFNLRNKRFAIGNLELPPDKYKGIKAKLLSEMLSGLKRDKRLPSLIEIAGRCGKPSAPKIPPAAQHTGPLDKSRIEEAFSRTMALLFCKKPLKGIDFYSGWLVRNTRNIDIGKSASSGRSLYIAQYGNYSDLPRDRLLSLREAQALGASARLEMADAESITLASAHAKIGKIAFFNTEINDGQNSNDIECAVLIDAVNCYRTVCSAYSKYCAYSFWPQKSDSIFGCDIMFWCSFCVKCYNSVNLKRCLEMDSCSTCADCLFCHNCENLQNCMFCFNAKNLRNAIGNVEIGQERYAQLKKEITGEIVKKVEKDHALKISVYNVGCRVQ